MNSLERIRELKETGRTDRVITCPFIDLVGAQLIGEKIRNINFSSRLMADLKIETYRQFGHDSLTIGPVLYGVAEALGVVLEFPMDSHPYVKECLELDYENIDLLPVCDSKKDGRLPIFLEGLEILIEEISDKVSIGSSVAGPFTTAATVIGIEKFLKDIRKNPQGVHALLDRVTKSVLNYMDAVMDLGIVPTIPDPVASGMLISTKTFREFVFPYLEICTEHIRCRMGRGPTLHICGTTKKHWLEMKKLNLSALSLDNIDDIGEACNVLGDKFCIIGNVDPVEVILNGTRESIHKAVKECIEKAYRNPKGFILSSGCDIPAKTSPKNLEYFMEAARLYSRFK